MKKLKDAGYENSEQYQILKSAIDDYNSASDNSAKNDALERAAKAAGDCDVNIKSLNKGIQNLWNNLDPEEEENFNNYFKNLKQGTKYSEDDIKEIGDTGKLAADELIDNTTDELDERSEEVPQAIEATISFDEGAIKEVGTNAGNTIATALCTELSSEKNKGYIKDSITESARKAVENSITSLKARGKGIGSYIVAGIIDGLKDENNISLLKDEITNLTNTMQTTFEENLDIHSPSRVFADLAKYVPLGVAQGITKGTSYASDAVSKFSDEIKSKFNVDSIDISSIIDTTKMQDCLDSTKKQISSFNDDIKSSLQSQQFGISVNPSIKTAQMNSALSDKSALSSGLETIYNKLQSLSSNSNNNGKIYCTLNMDKRNMASFVIDTVNGSVVQNGGF
jgi:hypothetical protein